MNTTRTRLRWRALGLVSAFSLAALPPLAAQAAKPKAAEADASAPQETIELSPFIVEASEDTGYTATSTLAGTRVRTELKDVASAITVVTSQFLKDTGSKNSQDLLVYTTNTEVAGVRGNFSAAGGASTYNEVGNLLRPSSTTRVRGLDAADNTRDYFLSEIPWDGYNVDRVDLQRGPNSILFGVGSPAGIINTSVNAATFRNANKIENRISRFGSFRTSADFNYVVKPGELAIRVAALDDDTKYQQKPAFNHDRRLYAALRYEPKLFSDDTRTSIRLNYETGDVDANRPRSLPPVDAITPWFLTGANNGVPNLNKLTLNPNVTWARYGENWNGTNGQYPWFREAFMGRLFNANIAGIYDASSGLLTHTMPSAGTPLGRNASGAVDGTISDIPFGRLWGITTYNNYARTALPGGKYYSNVALSDASIFDFYNNLIDGDNKREWQGWEAANLAFSQTFFKDRLGFEVVYDYQRYEDGQLAFLNGDQYSIAVDINTHLMDGSVNPNVGRPYVGNSGQYGNSENYIDRDNLRLTAFAEVNAEDYLGKTWLGRLLGRHVLTGLLSREDKDTDQRSFARWANDPAFTTALGLNGDITSGLRQYDWISYIGPSLASRTTASGANLNRIQTVINPNGSVNTRYFDSHWTGGTNFSAPYTYTTYDSNGNPVSNAGTQADNSANYVGWRNGTFQMLNYDNAADRSQLYSSVQKAFNRIESTGLVLQSFFWDGVVVPTYGWRRDKVSNASSQAPKLAHDVSDLNFDVDRSDTNTRKVEGESKSWGVVVHTPRAWREKLPLGTNISLFVNRSENFKADAPRGDIFGNMIPNPEAETKDYGVVLNTLNDRLTIKATWYETKMKNATLQADSAGFSNNLYYSWAIPYWGATHALAALDGISVPQLRQGDWGWPWNGIATLPGGAPDNARIEAIVRDYFKNFPLSQQFVDEYGLGMNVAAMRSASTFAQMYASVPAYGVGGKGAGDGLGLQPAYGGRLKSFGSNPVASVDTTSKGVEVEISAQPTKEWSVAVNFSKTMASRDAISPTIATWIDTYTKFLAGDAGLVRLWGGDTFRKAWSDNILAPYAVLKAQLGSSAPEVAPWRFNAVTNYNFSHGALKNANLGLGYRWEDRRILGYAYDKTKDVLDISKPFHGPTEDHIDLWAGYQRPVSKKVTWRVQLNLRNVGESAHLVPVNVQPDGSVALSRIQEGMIWQLTNTFSF